MPPPPPTEASAHETVARTFSRLEVSELFALSVRRLKSWEARGIVAPSASGAYSFTDLLAVRAARGLADAGFTLARIQKAVEALRRQLPELTQPITDARLVADGSRLVARRDGTSFDPTTGQLTLDFDVRALTDDVVKVLRPKVSQRTQEAYGHYLEGLRLDEDETTRERAESEYRKAIALDPWLATAITNLGNLRLLAGDRAEAMELYRRGMAADASQAEAPYNLAFILAEDGQQAEAVPLFERAIALRPDFAEAHFNLAMALTELGQLDRAKPSWQRYVDLDPRGPWATIARYNLDPE